MPVDSLGSVLFEQTAKALIRLHRCAIWSEPLLFSYASSTVFACFGSDEIVA